MQKLQTYFINYTFDHGEFDYFIFHTKSEKRADVIKDFKKLLKKQEKRTAHIEIIDVIKYNPKNYPTA